MSTAHNRNGTVEMVMMCCDSSNSSVIKSSTEAVHMVLLAFFHCPHLIKFKLSERRRSFWKAKTPRWKQTTFTDTLHLIRKALIDRMTVLVRRHSRPCSWSHLECMWLCVYEKLKASQSDTDWKVVHWDVSPHLYSGAPSFKSRICSSVFGWQKHIKDAVFTAIRYETSTQA